MTKLLSAMTSVKSGSGKTRENTGLVPLCHRFSYAQAISFFLRNLKSSFQELMYVLHIVGTARRSLRLAFRGIRTLRAYPPARDSPGSSSAPASLGLSHQLCHWLLTLCHLKPNRLPIVSFLGRTCHCDWKKPWASPMQQSFAWALAKRKAKRKPKQRAFLQSWVAQVPLEFTFPPNASANSKPNQSVLLRGEKKSI